jgi:hypothetical protein
MTEITTVKGFINAFAMNTLGKKTVHGRWSVVGLDNNVEALTYTPSDYPKEHEDLAYRLPDGSVLSNANQLEYIGRRFAWGYERNKYGGRQEPEQRWLELDGAVPLPFTLFNEVPGMDITKFSWICKPVPETVKEIIPPVYSGDMPKENIRHFSGACLFAIGDSTYLFDIDRQEIEKHGIFNAFLTKLPSRVETIKDAYDVLIPDEVRTAIVNGADVQRQGEFFFIKYSDKCPVESDLTDEEKHILKFPPSRLGYGVGGGARDMPSDRQPFKDDVILDTPEKVEFQVEALKYKRVFDKYSLTAPKAGTLGKSATGSHSVERYIQVDKDVYASGRIEQNRRQHGDLILNGWYKVFANTGTLSWTITGDID